MRRRKSLAITAGAVVAGVVLAACSTSSSPSTSSSSSAPAGGGSAGSSSAGSSSPAAAGTANAAVTGIVSPSDKTGGTITFANSDVPDSFDPGNTYYGWVQNFSRLYATPMITYKSAPGPAGNTVVPGIATALGQVSADGLTWTYHIKPGLKYEDGSTVTAGDVKYAIERTYDRAVMANGPDYFPNLLTDPKYPGPYKAPNADLTGITVPDPNTIIFHLVKPFPDFDYVLALTQSAPVPKAKDTGAKYQMHVMSTGPYMFQSYSLNKQLTLVPNPNFTQAEDTEAKQLASKIVINLSVNADTIDNELIAGTLDVDSAGSGVQAAARAKILSSPTLMKSSDNSLSNRLWLIYLNSKVAPLDNVSCRQAIEFAAPKTDLQTAYGGPVAGGDVASTVLLPGMPGYSAFDLYNAKSQPGGDVTSAKAALAKCGQPNGFSTNLAYRTDRPKEVAAATAMQAALAKVGIKVTLKGHPSGGYYTEFAGAPAFVHKNDLGISMGGWIPDWPDGYGMMDSLVDGRTIVATGNTNIGELNDPAVNKLFDDTGKPGLTADQRGAIFGQIDKAVMQQAVILPEVYAKSLLYRSSHLTNVYVIAAWGEYNYAVLGATS
jgi:peptide/nickel transport system substrate-binding protein